MKQIKYKFKVIGVPPSDAFKDIKFDSDIKILEMKKIISAEYKLGPFEPQLYYRDQYLENNELLSKYKIDSKKGNIEIHMRRNDQK